GDRGAGHRGGRRNTDERGGNRCSTGRNRRREQDGHRAEEDLGGVLGHLAILERIRDRLRYGLYGGVEIVDRVERHPPRPALTRPDQAIPLGDYVEEQRVTSVGAV